MACQSKTFINDLGSDVVAEITNQLNTATAYTQWTGAPVTLSNAGAAQNMVIAYFGEDVFIEDVVISLSAAGGNADNAASVFSLAVGTAPAGTGGVVAVSGTGFGGTALSNDQFASFKDDVLFAATTDVGVFPFAIDAGNSLALRINLAVGDGMNNTVVNNVVISYRPVKDKLTLSPAVPAKAFSSINR
jgi:hypothetical protein